MNTSEKVAYVKGLAEGLGYDNTSKEGKILAAILDILEDVAHDIEDLEESDCCCGCGDADGEPVFYEVTCPACGNTITIDEDVLDLGEIECPNCGETLEFDGLEEDEESGDEDKPEDD